MVKNRICYGLLMACLAVLVFLYSKPFLIFSLIVLAVLGVLMAILGQVDASNLRVSLQAQPGAQEGRKVKVQVHIDVKHHLYAARSILIGMDVHNSMFCHTERRYYFIYLTGSGQDIEIELPADRCGEMRIECAELLLQDLLKLFRRKIRPFEETGTTIYPRGVNVHVEMSRMTIGAPRDEGRMQNRKGNDPSEMFDIREYVPGDDIRSIHWKLSSKTDSLILREASDPSHYNVVLLPDFGRKDLEKDTTEEEINTAVAFGTAIGEQLLRRGCAFCMAIPGEHGLYLKEVRDRRDLNRMLAQWLASPIPEESGQALQYFMLEHLEQYFTRLLVLSAGAYRQNLTTLSNEIGSTVISARSDLETLISTVNGNCEMIDIPVKKSDEVYRIIC